ncbi:MAG: iron ABC transporter permease, partial [Gammaproteobacteria bacterium]|nr:iron ABC transporter permease [Gammaproteobacteria bacterium]MDH5778886.1 iron ABC transporter permease [Gammaproteobacteria bacterium]
MRDNFFFWLKSHFTSRGMLSVLVVLTAIIPLGFVVINSWQLSTERWLGLWSSRLPGLLWNTLSLSIFVALGSFLLGVSAAWLIVRRKFIGRQLAIWLLVLPLTIPTYVFAHIYTILLERDGWLGQLWLWLFGADTMIPELYNVVGVSFVLSLAGFSYVFLLVRDALSRSHQNIEDAARIQGASPSQVFWRISLPMLRPAIAAGLALVVLHTLSDFGAVSMLRYQTFTLSIYLQMNGRFDFQAAAGLSFILVCLSLTFLILERFFRKRQRYYSSAQSRKLEPEQAKPLEQVLIWLWLGLIVTFAFLLPLAWMLVWSWDAWMKQLIDEAFWSYAENSLIISMLAACIAVLAALPVALYQAKRRNLMSQTCVHLASIGFVLPGPVIALGILGFVLAMFPNIYGGLTVLVMAMVIRFLPLAVQSQESAVQQLTPSIEQAGRSLGAGPLRNLWQVILPMMRGGLISAWVLVFIDTLKELPATLLLRPTGFDTLPVRIWIEASEEMLELAAPAALMLVIGTLPVLWFLMRPNKTQSG